MVIAKLNSHTCVHSKRSHTLRKQSSDCQSLFYFGKFHHVKCVEIIPVLKDAMKLTGCEWKKACTVLIISAKCFDAENASFNDL